jgi:hypothetical protein
MFTIYLICFLAGVGFSALSFFSMFAHGLHFHGGHHGHHGHHAAVQGHAQHGHAQHGQAQHGPAQQGHAPAQQAQAAAAKSNGVVKAAQRAVAESADTATPWLLRINITAIVLFLAIFGGVGLLLEDKHQLTSVIAGVIAAVCGLAGSAAVNRVLAAMMSRERPLEPVTFTGTLAQVTIPIREAGGTGEIVYTIEGTRRCSGARSDDGRGIGKGAEVVIVRYDRGIAYVAAFDEKPAAPILTLH